jgi:sortase (surface protein transpeptidase)
MKKTLTRSAFILTLSILIFHFSFDENGAITEVYRSKSVALASVTEEQPVNSAINQISSVLSVPVAYGQDENGHPVSLAVPSIGLNSPVQEVGVNALGEMDVPSGKTNNVGWYKDGTVPGNIGSAVLDAHVFAAFKNLKNVKVGDDIILKDGDGHTLIFRVEEATVYAIKDVPLQRLFNANDGVRLNLITCAGNLTPDGKTYDHRLIVYAKLVE